MTRGVRLRMIMSYWERFEVLGDDSYGYDDDLNGHASYFDYDDPRDYEEWCDWNNVDAAEGYYHPDRLHGEGGFGSCFFSYVCYRTGREAFLGIARHL